MVKNLYPTAPFDRVDKPYTDSLTGAAPMAPTDSMETEWTTDMKPDFVSRFDDPRFFPAQVPKPEVDGATITNIDDKELIAYPDRLRPGYMAKHFQTSIDANYPNVAPHDRIPDGPFPVAGPDRVPEDFARFATQVNERELARDEKKHETAIFDRMDQNKDGAVSRDEYVAEVQGRQNKTDEEMERLWQTYHTAPTEEMLRPEVMRMADTGFNLGTILRSDVSSVLEPPSGTPQGFWGSGAVCPVGHYVNAARLKVMPTGGGADNTGLNRVAFKCTDGTETQTIEGPDGQWGQWAECPDGQRIFSLRARTQAFSERQDNSGVNDLEFACRAPDLSAFSKLRFGTGLPPPQRGEIQAVGPSAIEGNWSPDMMCGPGDALCGMQANVKRDQGEGDDIGITDIKAYCCTAPIDCTRACGAAGGGPLSVQCRVCHKAKGSDNTPS
jgi:hypothetical protein